MAVSAASISSAQKAPRDSGKESWFAFWLSLVRIALCEAALLLALGAALVAYLNWSSERKLTEFLAASSAVAQPVKGHTPCNSGT